LKNFVDKMRLSLCFTLILSLFMTLTIFANDSTISATENISDVQMITSDTINTEAVEVTNIYEENVIQEVGMSVVNENTPLSENQIYADEYGGAFIDDSGNVNILLLDNSKSLKNISNDSNRNISKKIIKSSDKTKNNKQVNLKKVKFCMADLKDIYNYLSDNSKELGIGIVYIDIPLNQVVVEIINGNKSNENNITNTVSKSLLLKTKDSRNALSFKYITQNDIPKLVSAISPTTGGSTSVRVTTRKAVIFS